MWIGIDDTDSPQGGCTTYALTEVVRLARDLGLDLLGEPRLVRLNPNVPWKTRGNAALAARIGHGRGLASPIGEVFGEPVLSYSLGGPLTSDEQARLVEAVWRRLGEIAPRVRGTDPALVATNRSLPARWYWRAVRDVVPVRRVIRDLASRQVLARSRGSRRGLVGASAAIAWPGVTATWELLAYRRAERIGLPRDVDPTSVAEAERAEPELFLCRDERTRRTLVAPHTRCPILFGLRGRTPQAPLRARTLVRSEPVDRWLLFRTNQGTGDHLVPRRSTRIPRLTSAIVEGTVAGPSAVLRGGHVSFPLRIGRGGRLTCLAFEPTKTLPAVARSLRSGDHVEVWGSRDSVGALRLEGVRVVELASSTRWEAPRCPSCDRRMGSLGALRGWRCERCRARLPPEAGAAVRVRRELRTGTYHPTRSARRHLAPLEA